MEKIDVFAHVLLPKYYNKMLEINSDIPNMYAFTNIDSLKDMVLRRNLWNGEIKQIISYANINAEDFCKVFQETAVPLQFFLLCSAKISDYFYCTLHLRLQV